MQKITVNMTAEAIGQNVFRRRHSLQITQVAAAKLAGVSQGTWSDIERARQLPGLMTLLKVSAALECPVASLLN